MRRSVGTIVGTLAGTALLIGAKLGTHPAAGTATLADPGAVQPAAANPPAASASRARPAPGSSSARHQASPSAGSAGLRNGTFTGGRASERYGTITVTITVAGGRLTGATATCSGCGGTSRSISGNAFPSLRQEALAAQSARIATVSGATYTSSAYRASLQSALDAAKAA